MDDALCAGCLLHLDMATRHLPCAPGLDDEEERHYLRALAFREREQQGADYERRRGERLRQAIQAVAAVRDRYNIRPGVPVMGTL